MIHELANVKAVDIGKNTKIWQYSVISEGVVIGENCNICAHTFIESDVVIGSNVTIKSGVYLWSGTKIADNVFIGPNATFSNDKYPRSKNYAKKFEGVVVQDGASIGANATLLPGIVVGVKSMIGAGSVVTKNVPDYALVYGNPARLIRFLDQ